MSKSPFLPARRMACRGVAVLACGLSTGFLAPGAAAQSSLMIDVAPCIGIQSTIERFQCYESRAENALAGSSVPAASGQRDTAPRQSGNAGNASRQTVPAPGNAGAGAIPRSGQNPGRGNASAEDSFGLPEPRAGQEESDQEELFSTVAELEETVPNSHIITLENGQVWRQMRPERYRLQVGHKVRIYPSSFGSSFRLSAEELRGFIQVERIR